MDASASRRLRDNLSFSSTLLDEIYRSIDQQSTLCNQTTPKKQSKIIGCDSGKSRNRCFEDGDDDERRASLYHKWMESKVCEKPVVGKSSPADFERRSMRCERDSRSSSCSSSCVGIGVGVGVVGGGFSSSEAESVYGVLVKPKPIRIGVYQHDEFNKQEKQKIVHRHDDSQVNAKHEGKFVKTKLKAMRIYSDLKKGKQPISPGGRLTTFLNSLFTTGNNKKPNTSTATTSTTTGDRTEAARNHLDRKSKSANASTCSSASSFSRSCLSNTPSSRSKLCNEMKRSVRFYPVSVIVDEDSQPCGHKSLIEEETDSNCNKFTQNSSDRNRHISEAAMNLLKNYQKKVECEFDSVNNNEEDNQSNDEKSDSSSDLFELNNLSPTRIHNHQEELPLYASTHLHTNRAIANKNFFSN